MRKAGFHTFLVAIPTIKYIIILLHLMILHITNDTLNAENISDTNCVALA